MPEDGPQIRPSRDRASDRLYDGVELTTCTVSVTSFHGKGMLSTSGNGRGPGIESPVSLQTLYRLQLRVGQSTWSTSNPPDSIKRTQQ